MVGQDHVTFHTKGKNQCQHEWKTSAWKPGLELHSHIEEFKPERMTLKELVGEKERLIRHNTLYCQKYSLTHSNNWNQELQSLPWPHVYKSKHLGMQTNSTNICERNGHSLELSEFQHGTVIGCYLCNKSSCEIFSLLNIPQSTVSGIITKWKWLGMTATQPQSGKPYKMTERGQWMLRHIVCRGHQLSAESVVTNLQT